MSDPVAWGMDAASAVSVDTMRANGATFICCYLAPYPSQSWKMRTPAQIKEYVSAGFDVVFNWESDGTPGNGYSTGVDAAKQAQAQLYDRGFANAPVIFRSPIRNRRALLYWTPQSPVPCPCSDTTGSEPTVGSQSFGT